ncbi:MAG: starch-binding protein [Muribaculaceae bacterium]|jgi:hypothetical protein|nr:starch-binding protein [Muribaculaceae bacterium]MEE1337777.1 starch-binding protein [Muribaculaceae bacterium]
MKKFYFLFTLLLSVLVANAATIPAGTKLYLTPNSNWKQSNARYAAYFFGNGEAWVSMTKVAGETDLYELTSPSKSYTNVIFCRMNPSTTANNWNNKWNQTADLTYDGTNNHYTVKANTWDKGGGTWSYYGKTEELLLGVSWTPSETIYPGDNVTITATAVGQPENSSIQITIDGTTTTGTTANWVAGEAGNYTVKVACVDSNSQELGSTEQTLKVTAITSEWGIYLDKASTKWTNANLYTWDANNTTYTGTWPGNAMGVTTVNGTEYYYSLIRNAKTINLIFNNGTEQTVDITGISGESFFKLTTKNGEGKWQVEKVENSTGGGEEEEETETLVFNVTVPAGTENCYIVGSFNEWGKFVAMEKAGDNNFTVSIDNLKKSEVKYKYTCGEGWDYVEMQADKVTDVQDRSYTANDVVAAWKSTPSTTVTYPEKVYIVGHDNAWDPAKPLEISGTDGVYTIDNVTFVNTGFKMSTQKGSWDAFNAGVLYVQNAIVNEEATITKGSSDDSKISATGTFNLTIDLVNMTFLAIDPLTVAIEEVATDNAPIEYYNLQGVKVANPENGIFIKKQGSKTTKVVL